MNCDDYRQAIAADPEFEERLFKALKLDVPPLTMPELPDVADNVVALSTRRAMSKPAWFALAASVMLAAVIGVRMLGVGVGYESLADEVVAHLDHEPYALRVTDEPVKAGRLARVVPASIGNINHDAGLVTYAQTCRINGKDVPHLVIQGEVGPVTILLMPEESVAEATPLEGANIHGLILPVGNGSIAIIGAREENLERIENNVVNSVNWST